MRARPKAVVNPAGLLAALAAIAATGCATGYGAKGLSGGYSDQRIDDTHYVVEFQGNGHTSKDRVWNFWFYRCAELTLEKGFVYFDLESAKKGDKQSFLEDPSSADRLAGRRPAPSRAPYVPAGYVYTYVPATTVTTWNSKAIVAMYPALPEGKVLFDARRVQELLGPYVRSDGSETAPERKLLIRGAVMKIGASRAPERVFPDGVRIGFLDTKRVVAEVAESKAAVARIRASLEKKRTEVDAGKVEVDKLRAAYDTEPDAKRKTVLEGDLDTRKKKLQASQAAYQAALKAEEKKAIRQILDRAGPLVERVRSAQRLDTLSEDAAGGLWDADITDEVIRLYDQTYPVPPAS